MTWSTGKTQGKSMDQFNERVEEPRRTALWADAQRVVNIVFHKVVAALTLLKTATGQARVLHAPGRRYLSAVDPGDAPRVSLRRTTTTSVPK